MSKKNHPREDELFPGYVASVQVRVTIPEVARMCAAKHPWDNNKPHTEQWTLVDQIFMEKREPKRTTIASAETQLSNINMRLTELLNKYPHKALGPSNN